MMTEHAIEPVQELRAFGLTVQTYRAVAANFGPMAKAMIVPWLLAVVFGRLVFWLMGDAMMAMEGGDPYAATAIWGGGAGLFNIIGSLIVWYLTMAYAVTCHRINLIGIEPRSGFFGLNFGKRVWRFIGYSIIIWLIVAASTMVIMMGTMAFGWMVSDANAMYGGVVLMIPVIVVVAIVGLRFLITLPMIAVDGPTGLRSNLGVAWKLMKGSTLALFFAFILVNLPFLVLVIVVGAVSGLLTFIGDTILPAIAVQYLASFGSIALTATLLSVAFRTLTGFDGGITKQAGADDE